MRARPEPQIHLLVKNVTRMVIWRDYKKSRGGGQGAAPVRFFSENAKDSLMVPDVNDELISDGRDGSGLSRVKQVCS